MKKQLVLVAALVVVIAVVVVVMRPSEEKKIKRQFAALSKEGTKEAGESLLAIAYAAQTLPGLFDTNCAIVVRDEMVAGRYTPEELASLIARARAEFVTMTLSFSDLKIEIPQKTLATVGCTVRLTGKTGTGENVNEAREIVVALQKREKNWLFSEFKEVEVLKK